MNTSKRQKIHYNISSIGEHPACGVYNHNKIQYTKEPDKITCRTCLATTVVREHKSSFNNITNLNESFTFYGKPEADKRPLLISFNPMDAEEIDKIQDIFISKVPEFISIGKIDIPKIPITHYLYSRVFTACGRYSYEYVLVKVKSVGMTNCESCLQATEVRKLFKGSCEVKSKGGSFIIKGTPYHHSRPFYIFTKPLSVEEASVIMDFVMQEFPNHIKPERKI